MSNIKLSIIIPVFNNWQYTKNAMENLKTLCQTHYEVIVVDNASSDETQEKMMEYVKSHPVIKYIRNEENFGFGKACNIGWQSSLGSNMMFLNNDVKFGQPVSNWINDFVNTLEAHPNSLIGPTGGFVDPKKNFEFCYETNDQAKEINYMSGWCLSASKDTWNKLTLNGRIGPFDSDSFYLYYEDTDVSMLAAQLGIKFVLTSVPLTHLARKTSTKYGMIKYYNTSKNIFIEKWKHLIK